MFRFGTLIVLCVIQCVLCARPLVAQVKNLGGLQITYPESWTENDKRAVVILFSGEVWQKGDVGGDHVSPFSKLGVIDYFRQRGLVVVLPPHKTLASNLSLPEIVEDARNSVRVVRKNAQELGVSPNKVVACGACSGGHIAACLSFIPSPQQEDISSGANTTILFCPYMNIEAKTTELGISKDVATALSPARHVEKGDPPCIIFVGSDDPLQRNLNFVGRKMRNVGIQAEVVVIPRARHGLKRLWTDQAQRQVEKFLTQYSLQVNQ